MPNHVTNKITLEVANLLKSDKSQIDFNTVLPMPESLIEPDPQQLESRAKAALGMYTKPTGEAQDISDLTNRMQLSRVADDLFKPLEKDKIELLIQAIKNISEHGFAYWYPWANHHWGTKWNAYSIESDDQFVTFETAWSHPKPVFLKLSELNPGLLIRVQYADEDTGCNCGTVVYQAGEIVSEEIAPRWDDSNREEKAKWTEFAFNLRYPNEDPRAHGYDENWNYSDEIYEAYEKEQEQIAN